jgi:acetate kinase
MPRVAKLLPIPRRYDAAGIQRYGFHGLSYAFLMETLSRVAGAEAARGRIILAHLGSGASMAAVHNGRSMDTTMGFTPAAGMPMGTRPGDMDPGILWYWMHSEHLSAAQINRIINHQSGLIGVSESSADLRDLLARETEDRRAAEAVELYCYHARKWIGSLAAALGGLETLVFSGGIGENAGQVRTRICKDLAFLGVTLDEDRNGVNAPVISSSTIAVTVRVIPTNEERMIVRAALAIMQGKGQ